MVGIMKKFLLICLLLFGTCAFANEEVLQRQNTIQGRIDDCGVRILNANQIQEKIIFVYDEVTKDKRNIDAQFKKLYNDSIK